VPQAAGPVAFSLVALSLTGQATDGAAMILAMTLAQVCGAIPIARLGKSLPLATFLKLLVVFGRWPWRRLPCCGRVRSLLHLADRARGRCRIGQRRCLRLSARRAQPFGSRVAVARGSRDRGHAQ
jgi:hypothetical protein